MFFFVIQNIILFEAKQAKMIEFHGQPWYLSVCGSTFDNVHALFGDNSINASIKLDWMVNELRRSVGRPVGAVDEWQNDCTDRDNTK